MEISKDEFKSRIEQYTRMIPRFDWFSESEREKMALEAQQTADSHNENFLAILENLAFMRSFEGGQKPS
jgi:hypothetical protein